MNYWHKNLRYLCAATFLASNAFTLSNPFLPMFITELGVTENLSLWSGIMVSVNFLTYALVSPVWGSLADRHGKRIMFIRSGFGIAATLFMMSFVTSHWQLLFLRTANGLFSGFIPSAIMLVASNTPEDKMGYALGMLNTFVAIGNIMGPFAGGALVKLLGIRQVMLVSGGLLTIATALAFFGTREKIVIREERTSPWQDVTTVMRNRYLPIYFLCMVVLQMGAFTIQPILPLRIAELTDTNIELYTGLIFSIMGISLALGSPLICRITRFSYREILTLGLAFGGILSMLQGFAGSVLLLGGTRFLYGFAHAAVNVSTNVLITQCSAEDMRGRVFGVLNSFTAFGGVLGPLLGGTLGEIFGNASAFHGLAVLFVLALLTLWISGKRSGLQAKISD